jgi:DNA-binding LacI/PurR family transcriptional regulator
MLSKYSQSDTESFERDFLFYKSLDRAFDEISPSGAWLFARDATALAALQWAQTRRIKVPRTLEILSFENSPDSPAHGLSCCVADWDRIGYLLAHALIGDVPVERSRKGFIRMSAMVIERETT